MEDKGNRSKNRNGFPEIIRWPEEIYSLTDLELLAVRRAIIR